MKRKIVQLIVIMALLIFLNACASENQPTLPANPTLTIDELVGAGSLTLTGSACSAPCLLGIQPEVTGYNEAIRILSKNNDLGTCKEYNRETDGGGRGLQCENSFVITFDADGKIVTGLGYSPTSNFTVQNVLDTFGDPKNLEVATDYSKPASTVRLFYPNYKMSIVLDDQAGEAYTISPDIKVRTVTYNGEKTYQALTLLAQHWSGFGKYTN